MYKIINPNTKTELTSFNSLKDARYYIMSTGYVIEYSRDAVDLENKRRG